MLKFWFCGSFLLGITFFLLDRVLVGFFIHSWLAAVLPPYQERKLWVSFLTFYGFTSRCYTPDFIIFCYLTDVLVSNKHWACLWWRISPTRERPVPRSRRQIQPPKVVKGCWGWRAASEHKHGQGPVVIDSRVWISFGNLLTLGTLAATWWPEKEMNSKMKIWWFSELAQLNFSSPEFVFVKFWEV